MSNKPVYTVGFYSHIRNGQKAFSKFHILLNGKALCGYKPDKLLSQINHPFYIMAYADCKTCLKLYAKQTGENT